MTRARTNALQGGLAALLALMLLQLVWHWPGTTARLDAWLMTALTTLPLLASAWICRRNLRRGVLIGGILCLAYFCHGIVVAWAEPAQRAFGLVEVGLSVIVIFALGWDARHFKRQRKLSS